MLSVNSILWSTVYFEGTPFSLSSLSLLQKGASSSIPQLWKSHGSCLPAQEREVGWGIFQSTYVSIYSCIVCTYVHMYCTYVGMYVLYCIALYYIPCFYLLQDLCSDLLLSIYLFFFLFIIFKLTNKTNPKKKGKKKRKSSGHDWFLFRRSPFGHLARPLLGNYHPSFFCSAQSKPPSPLNDGDGVPKGNEREF